MKGNPLPTLTDLLNKQTDIALSNMNCINIGTIQEFDAETQTATISINYKRILKEAEQVANSIDRKDKIEDYPILLKVPVIVLNGGGAFLSFPIAKGDTCILLFCDREIDTWFTTGVITTPQSERIHSLTDGVAIVGIHSALNPIENFNTIIASLIDKTGERLSQAGDLKATARATASPGWLLCYGQAISRTTYDVLFAAIGTTYGSGDGTTTFNLPDFRGRGFRGLDNMGGNQADVLSSAFTPNRNTLGGAVGEESHLLTGQESGIQQHRHTDHKAVNATGELEGTDGWRSATQTATAYTGYTGHTDAINRHNNIPTDRMVNIEIKY